MTDDLDRPHPLYPKWTVRQWQERHAELGAAALEMAQLENAGMVADFQQNERYRDQMVATWAQGMRARNASEVDIAAMVDAEMARPNEHWGELHAGRVPPDDM